MGCSSSYSPHLLPLGTAQNYSRFILNSLLYQPAPHPQSVAAPICRRDGFILWPFLTVEVLMKESIENPMAQPT